MSLNEQLQSKIELLNNYALCLERENQSKTNEITTLYNHLDSINQENESLRVTINQMRSAMSNKQQEDSIIESLPQQKVCEDEPIQTIKTDAQCQTYDGKEPHENLISEIKSLREIIKQKENKISNYQDECQQMYDGIVKLEKCLSDQQIELQNNTETIKKLEQKVKIQEKRRIITEKQLDEVNQSITSADEYNDSVRDQYYSLECEISRLVTENNRLIERCRDLEKEKNQYYHQLRRLSRISFGNDSLSNSSLKKGGKVKDQRWKEIESNLRKLQLQNEAIQSNLLINR